MYLWIGCCSARTTSVFLPPHPFAEKVPCCDSAIFTCMLFYSEESSGSALPLHLFLAKEILIAIVSIKIGPLASWPHNILAASQFSPVSKDEAESVVRESGLAFDHVFQHNRGIHSAIGNSKSAGIYSWSTLAGARYQRIRWCRWQWSTNGDLQFSCANDS